MLQLRGHARRPVPCGERLRCCHCGIQRSEQLQDAVHENHKPKWHSLTMQKEEVHLGPVGGLAPSGNVCIRDVLNEQIFSVGGMLEQRRRRRLRIYKAASIRVMSDNSPLRIASCCAGNSAERAGTEAPMAGKAQGGRHHRGCHS